VRIDQTIDPDVLHIRTGGGWLAVLGTPLFVLGAISAAIAAAGILDQLGTAPVLDNKFIRAATLGVACVIIGLSLMFKQSGFVINRRHGTVTSWSRFIWLRECHERRLDQFKGLSLVRYWNTARHGHEFLYRIVLESKASETQPIKLADQLDQHPAQAHFQQLAVFLRMPTTHVDEQM